MGQPTQKTDPWADDPSMKGSASAQASSPQADDSWKVWNDAPAPAPEARTAGNYANEIGTNAVAGLGDFFGGMKSLIAHPIDTATQLGSQAKDFVNSREDEASWQGNLLNTLEHVPLIGGYVQQAERGGTETANPQAVGAGVRAAVAFGVAPKVAGEAARFGGKVVTGKVSPPLKGALAPRMYEPIAPGEALSRADVVRSAQDNGVHLDAATATGHPLLRAVNHGNKYTIGGTVVGEEAANANMKALTGWADRSMNQSSPYPSTPESTAQAVRDALLADQQFKSEQAGKIFDQLTERNGTKQPDLTEIRDQARQIVQDNADYYRKNPDLMPRRAWAIVNNLADRGETPKANSAPIAPDTWSDLHKLRTDLMNEYRSPDIAGSRSEGWLKQLVEKTDNTMTGAASQLERGDLELFRKANDIYSSMKDTYDNPQHPFYSAVRGPYDQAAAGLISNQVPGVARDLRTVLDARGPGIYGQIQRQVLQNVLQGMSKDGVPDFKTLDTRVGRLSPQYLTDVFGDRGAKNIQAMGKVGSLATADLNPSGTAKAVVPAGEIGSAFKTTLGLPFMGVNYGVARFLHSPKVLDYLTTPRK